jgi:hypothetical protein
MGVADMPYVPDMRTVSSRPEYVSGGDVLVEITAPAHDISRPNGPQKSTRTSPRNGVAWSVRLNGRDVTASFLTPLGIPNTQLALLTGLQAGANNLEMLSNGRVLRRLRLVDHPASGPIFSGPHQTPFECQNEANGLAPAIDAACSAATRVHYYYKSTQAAKTEAPPSSSADALSPGFKPYDPAGPRPSDIAKTVTTDGRTVDYIVRRELGTINRAVYDIQFLHEPGTPLPTPWQRTEAGWNGRLVYSFGGGCRAGYRQGTLGFPGYPAAGAAQESLLSQGYAVATSTLNIFQNNCNDRVSAETLSMVKEHFIEQFGEPVHTIGIGGSGGAVQVYLIAQNQPGLLDAIIPFLSFPDLTTTVQSTADCSVLDHFFATHGTDWTDIQKTAVSGFAKWSTCGEWLKEMFIRPDECDESIPKALIYTPRTRRKGVRCTVYDNEIHAFGRDPHTGFAYRPLDNVGVQYGLVAFNAGKITADQFIELNEQIGGHDIDGNWIPHRTEAPRAALRIAHEQRLVFTGSGSGLDALPIIDWRPYLDDRGDQHDRFRSLATRARLLKANGHADNQVILVDPGERFPAVIGERLRVLVRETDRWLDQIVADRASGSQAAKVARNKPASLADGCWTAEGKRIVEPASLDSAGQCQAMYPAHGDPRIAAGAPETDDILKCALKPIDPNDYQRPLSATRLNHLQTVFPTGVCDYTRADVGR